MRAAIERRKSLYCSKTSAIPDSEDGDLRRKIRSPKGSVIFTDNCGSLAIDSNCLKIERDIVAAVSATRRNLEHYLTDAVLPQTSIFGEHRPKRLMSGGRLTYLVCGNAREGDILLACDEVLYLRGSDVALIVRRSTGPPFDIIGQAIRIDRSVELEAWTGPSDIDQEVDISVDLSTEDALILSYQDYTMAGNNDTPPLPERLVTLPTSHPIHAVRMRHRKTSYQLLESEEGDWSEWLNFKKM